MDDPEIPHHREPLLADTTPDHYCDLLTIFDDEECVARLVFEVTRPDREERLMVESTVVARVTMERAKFVRIIRDFLSRQDGA